MRICKIGAAAAACFAVLAVSAPASVLAQQPAAKPAAEDTQADALTNPAFKRAEVLAFIGVQPGWRVADIIAGRFTRAFSQAVGPNGKVYAVEPAEMVARHPDIMTIMNGIAAQPSYGNVAVSTSPINALVIPPGVDAVFIRQDYHDLHDKFMGPADIAAFNRSVFAALKPGGVLVVLDHAAAAGSGLRDTETLHRIDPAAVKTEVTAAGFVLDGESDVLANPADDHTKKVFDPSIRGHTDQFLLRFKKPG
ncbi:class I SAM-dependent methyltransferase [Phenylobacterium montanum]|uniref:Class I SAM-dependent methyltransferase n=1 Tax=Phenylobacterium montanum TaxID=2823693 RepID=A0A975G1S9_9CAUL|nr:class I SAM-dependent methyltransferase [Caulobacter sp. S6]QUD88988.1 class I SAM-dependent methyltransferase [Caulobacter sp. S6]